MCAQWVEFEKDADLFPFLKYRTIGDVNVRAEHEALNGIIKPIKDAFWASYYPPNGWNCRCGVRQVSAQEATPTPDEQIRPPGVSDMFKTNLAQTGLIFPKEHPYYIGVPKAEITKALAYLPTENSFLTVPMDNGQIVNFHVLHGKKELPINLDICNDLTNLGFKDIRLLPDLNEKDARLREKFLPPGYIQPDTRKNADAVLRDQQGRPMVAEFKNLTGPANIENRIKKAAQQAEYTIVKLNFDNIPPFNSLDNIVNKRLIKTESLSGVIILDKEGNIIIERYK